MSPNAFKVVEVSVGPANQSHALKLKCIDDMNKAIDELFDTEPDLLDEKNIPYYGNPWPAGITLADHMYRMGTWLEGKKVLEIGCGLAIPSLVCAHLGAQVVCTDIHPHVETLLRENLELNEMHSNAVRFVPFLFKDFEKTIAQELGTFDFIIASDVLYEKEHPRSIAQIAKTLCAKTGHIILVDPARNPKYLQAFVDNLKTAGFRADLQTKNDLYLFVFQK